MAHVFIVNGRPRAGKDTFIGMLAKIFGERGINPRSFSSIDPVRALVKNLGINVDGKSPADRKLLSIMGDALEEHSNLRTNACVQFVQSHEGFPDYPQVYFLHIREPENVEKVRKQLVAFGHHVWRVKLISMYADNVLHSDADYAQEKMVADYTIQNYGTLEDLFQEAQGLVSLIEHRTRYAS